jgi:hypothetical protein
LLPQSGQVRITDQELETNLCFSSFAKRVAHEAVFPKKIFEENRKNSAGL